MDLKLIQRLIRLMKGSGLGELELEDKESGLKLRMRRVGEREASTTPIVQVVQGTAPAAHAPAALAAPADGAAPRAAAPAEAAKPVGTPIASPMVGTFYRASSPEAEPFVRVGSRISVDSPLCIIEAMKVMNEIKAEVAGEILEVLVENGEPVEFGQPLFLVRPS